MRTRRILIFAVVSLAAVLGIVLLVVSPSLTTSARIRAFLSKVDSLEIIEFQPFDAYNNKLTDQLAVKTLSKDQIKDLISAFSSFGIMDSNACDFIPHHKMICHMQDHTTNELLVCFRCNEMQDADGHLINIGVWVDSLKDAFSIFGIPVREQLYRTNWQSTEQGAAANP